MQKVAFNKSVFTSEPMFPQYLSASSIIIEDAMVCLEKRTEKRKEREIDKKYILNKHDPIPSIALLTLSLMSTIFKSDDNNQLPNLDLKEKIRIMKRNQHF